MLSNLSIRKKTLLALALGLTALILISFDLVVGRATLPWDALDVFAPSFVLLADFARSGHLMLWNPWINAGSPEWIEPQLGAFSPVMLGFGLLFGGEGLAFRIYFLTAWWLSGLGVFLLGRRFCLPIVAAAALGFAWIFCGFSMGHMEHVPWMYTMTWLPFEILLLEQALARGSWRRFAALGAIWGLSMLGGHPGVAMNNWLLLFAWSVGRWLWPARDSTWAPLANWKRLTKILCGLLVAGTVGVVVLSPNAVGMFWEAVGVTRRSGALPRAEVVNLNPLNITCLLTLASSYLSSLPRAGLWPQTDASMCNVYVGAPMLAFAAMGLTQGRHWVRWGLLATAAGFFMVALGPALPLRGWLYDFVPFTRYQHHPAMYRGQAMMLLAVLGLLGARDLFRDSHRRGVPALITLILGLLSTLAFYRLCAMAKTRPSSLGVMHLYAAWGGCTLAMVLKDFSPRSWPRFRTFSWTTVLLLTILADVYFTNRLSTTNLSHDPASATFMGQLGKYHRRSLDLAKTSGFKRTPRVDGRGVVSTFSGWAGVFKEPTYYGYTAIINSYHERMVRVPAEQALSVGERKIWFSPGALSAPPSDGLFEAYVGRWQGQKNAPLILHEARDFKTEHAAAPEALLSLRNAGAMTPLDLQLIDYAPTRLEFQVAAPADGWILVTDRWSRSWRATVNEDLATLRPANFYYRALPVKAGLNHVRMAYKPYVVPILFALSWGTLLVVAALQFLWPGRKRDEPLGAPIQASSPIPAS